MNIKVSYPSPVHLDVTPCQEVKLCLAPEWAAKTVSGEAWVIAKIDNTNPRRLGQRHNWARGSDKLQYALVIDDAQILDETPGVKFKISCADINSVLDACALTA